MLGPQPSSEVELTEAPADRRPLRNLLADATLVRGLPAMLPALPRAVPTVRPQHLTAAAVDIIKILLRWTPPYHNAQEKRVGGFMHHFTHLEVYHGKSLA